MKINKITLSLLAVVITIAGTFAFTVKNSNAKKNAALEVGWFQLDNAAYPELASSYSYAGTTMPCSGDESLCAIKGTRNPDTGITIPYQDDVDNASDASDAFTHPVLNQVAFEE